jgi:glycine/D-amino acid oxidase-like deaminating enzyme
MADEPATTIEAMDTRTSTPDVAIVGGGVVGTAAAAFLAEGGMRVRLYERSAVAAGASGRNSGLLQHPFDAVLAELYRGSLSLYRELSSAESGFDLGDEPAGLLLLGHQPGVSARVAAAWGATWPASRPEVLAGETLRRLEPALKPDLVACRLEIGYPVAPAAATNAFAAVAARRGVEIVVAEATSIALDTDRLGVIVDGRIEAAGAVLVTAGPSTPAIIDPSRSWHPIRSVWGVVASIALESAPRHALESTEIAIEPATADDGPSAPGPIEPTDSEVDFSLAPAAASSALGSTFLAAEPDPAAWLPVLRRVGARYVAAITDAPLIGLRHCARPVSTDGRPLVGAVEGADGLFVAAGHGPWGISTGPASARIVSDLILGRIAPRDVPVALDPNRFGPIRRHESSSSPRPGMGNQRRILRR